MQLTRLEPCAEAQPALSFENQSSPQPPPATTRLQDECDEWGSANSVAPAPVRQIQALHDEVASVYSLKTATVCCVSSALIAAVVFLTFLYVPDFRHPVRHVPRQDCQLDPRGARRV